MTVGSEFGVSVVLPVYFSQRTAEAVERLEYALKSVMTQEFPEPFEVIIVDDGSPEPVRMSLAHLPYGQSPAIRWIRLMRNGGLANALNHAILAARYEFIARIDADDAWRPTKIEKQMKLFMNDRDLTIVGTGMSLNPENGSLSTELIRPGSWAGVLKFFTDVGCPFPHGSVVARRSIYKLLGGYPNHPKFAHAEDFALWSLWLRFLKPAMIEEVLYDYTVSNSSVSARHARQQRAASSEIQKRFVSLGNAEEIPGALGDLAQSTGLPLIEAGQFAYLAWKYMPHIGVPEGSIKALQALMPDRRIIPTNGGRRAEQSRPFSELVGALSSRYSSRALVPVEILHTA